MPQSATPIWILTLLVICVFPIVNAVYWDQLLTAGLLPPDGDSIAIPVFVGLVFGVIVAPIKLGVAWFCLRQYNSQTRFLTWRDDLPIRSILATTVLGLPAALLLAVDIYDAFQGFPWFEYLLSIYSTLLASWLLCLRAALIDQLN